MSNLGKRVLIVAYQFPPMGGSGVQRSTKFAKYLKVLGFEPIVYTVESTDGIMDGTLNEELQDIEIIRTKAYDFANWKGPFKLVAKVIKRKILMPDAQWLWYRKIRKHALGICKEKAIDILYTTSYPYSDHLVGLYIKKRLPDLKWVVDFRDEWTKNPYILDMNYNPLRKKIEAHMESEVVMLSDQLITNSPHMLEGFTSEYDIADKSTVISNGYDPYDFEGLIPKDKDTDKLTITYAGAMYGRRKPDLFLKSIKKLIDMGRIDEKQIRIQLIGRFSEAAKEQAYDWITYIDVLEFFDYMPHKESISFLLGSDVLLLIVGAGPGAKNFYTGKIFEYIYTGVPILAIVPEDGAAAGVIRASNTGYVIDSLDTAGITEQLATIYQLWKEGQLHIQPVDSIIKQYNRYEQTKDLIKVFERLR
ncbi:MAG: glycosyltransferase [Vallitaleaceae bacterium]|nr:glycosyltransferase [Vallitaleaceae bacterium]